MTEFGHEYVVKADSKTGIITNAIFPTGFVNRRTYEAVVDASGNGDYTTLSAAITNGAVSIFMRAGVYMESADINLPNGACITGESTGDVIIHFGGGAFSVVADGSGGTKETVGTISVTNGSAAVVGLGTTFTNLNPGDYIRIGTKFFPILSITDDTNLTLAITYHGSSGAGLTYIAQTMLSAICLQNLVITGTTVECLHWRGVRTSFVSGLAVVGGTGILIDDSGVNTLSDINVTESTGVGLHIRNGSSTLMERIVSNTNVSHGIQVSGNSDGVTCTNSNISSNGGDGLNVSDTSVSVHATSVIFERNNGNGCSSANTTSGLILTACGISYNGIDGIDYQGEHNKISSCIITNNGGRGIHCGNNGVINGCQIENNQLLSVDLQNGNDTTCTGCRIIGGLIGINLVGNRNSLTGNLIMNTNSDGINSTGDYNSISSNVIFDANGHGIRLTSISSRSTILGNHCSSCLLDGIRIQGNKNIVNANVCYDNSVGGCDIRNAANDTIVTSNQFAGNIGASFTDSGTATISANNIV